MPTSASLNGSPQARSNMQPVKAHPTYFIVRPGSNVIVPLIPADELPLSIDLVGVSRSLEVEQTIGMMNLGLVAGSGAIFELREGITPRAEVKGFPEGHDKLEPIHKVATAMIEGAKSTSPPTPATNHKAKINALATTTASTSLSADIDLSEKQAVCRHWAQTSECRWGNNCRHLHIMPLTVPELREAGLRDWPLWYRRSHAWLFSKNLPKVLRGGVNSTAELEDDEADSQAEDMDDAEDLEITEQLRDTHIGCSCDSCLLPLAQIPPFRQARVQPAAAKPHHRHTSHAAHPVIAPYPNPRSTLYSPSLLRTPQPQAEHRARSTRSRASRSTRASARSSHILASNRASIASATSSINMGPPLDSQITALQRTRRKTSAGTENQKSKRRDTVDHGGQVRLIPGIPARDVLARLLGRDKCGNGNGKAVEIEKAADADARVWSEEQEGLKKGLKNQEQTSLRKTAVSDPARESLREDTTRNETKKVIDGRLVDI